MDPRTCPEVSTTRRGPSREFAKEFLVAWKELPETWHCHLWSGAGRVLPRVGLTLRLETSRPLQQTKHEVRDLASQRRMEGLQFILNLVTRWTYRVDSRPAGDPGFEFLLGDQLFWPRYPWFSLILPNKYWNRSPQQLPSISFQIHYSLIIMCSLGCTRRCYTSTNQWRRRNSIATSISYGYIATVPEMCGVPLDCFHMPSRLYVHKQR
jgi:hypothetical protein